MTAKSPNPDWLNTIELCDGVKAWYTSRGDNADTDDAYSHFNICHYTGDSEAHTASCRHALCNAVGIEPERLIVPRQTHSVNCVTIDRLPVDNDTLQGVDALVTSLDNTAIGISTADCVPVLMADPVNRIIAAAHAGWRGAIRGIANVTLSEMLANGADISCIQVAMGPCICSRCFEVGDEVASQFPASCVTRNLATGKPHVDLAAYLRQSLIEAGIKENNAAELHTLQSIATLLGTRAWHQLRPHIHLHHAAPPPPLEKHLKRTFAKYLQHNRKVSKQIISFALYINAL